MDSQIPDNIALGVVAMLAPYCPRLTTERLQVAISSPSETDNSEPLLTRTEVSKALRISIPTVDRMLRSGELARRRIRGAVRIPASSVKRIVSGKSGDCS